MRTLIFITAAALASEAAAAGEAVPARAADPEKILCVRVEPSATNEELAQLGVWVQRAQPIDDADPRCDSAAAYTGRFERRGPQVAFVLQNSGSELDRSVPWLQSEQAALRQLQESGQLRKLALLIDGLLVEHSWQQPSPEPELPPATPDAITGAEPVEKPKPLVAKAPITITALPPSPAWYERWQLDVTLGAQARFRSPALAAPGLFLGVRFGPLSLEGAWAADAGWGLSDRQTSVGSVGGSAAWALELWTWERFSLRTRLGVATEHVWITRTDVPDATTHAHWDVGPTAAAETVFALWGPFAVGARVDATWFPTAREIRIPDVGTEQINAFALSGTFFLQTVIKTGSETHEQDVRIE